ncbi:RCC1 and BTB domain-containing protein 1-like isoform X1 [Scylla paramamosain]|uniref:RCC1 and BTB domain-containing protein 1-like isoform X1 n=1 Tax=Scylla paramamosain TaxID=85552 RepID=UPI003083B8BF
MFNQVYKVLAFKGSSTPTDTRTHHQIQEELIDELQNYSIVQVAAGDQHSLALTSWGLAINSAHAGLSHSVNTVQRAAGGAKQCAVVARGQSMPCAGILIDFIYARGDNGYGELGVNSCDSHTATRKLVKSLARKVTVQLACGANHTLALTADGDKIPWASWHLDTDRGPRRTLPW